MAALLALRTSAGAAEVLQPVAVPKPAFVLRDVTGTDIALDTLRGRVVLVHFFATWCEPCREELPALARLIERAGPSVSVIAISVGEVDVRVRRFMRSMPVAFPVLLDPERAVAKSWDVYALPTTYVLDADLNARLVSNGEFAWDGLTIGDLRDRLAAPVPKQSFDNHDQPREQQRGG